MKKAVLVATALLATVTAAPVMAAEFSYGGFMRFRGIFIDPGTAGAVVGAGPDNAQESNDRFEYRIRQFFNLKVNDHVTTSVKFEWNAQFGDEQQIAAAPGDLQFGGAPATTVNELQFRIKHAFLRFDVPGAPVSITVGQQDFSTPKAIVSVEDGTGVKVNAKVDPLDLTLWWQKNKNGDPTVLSQGVRNQTGVEDAHWFGIVPSFKIADITIAPHASYFMVGAGSTTLPDTDAWFLGVDSNGKLGPIGFTFDFIYQTGDTRVGPIKEDINSFILDASASLATGPGTLTAKFLYSPGDDKPLDNKLDSWVNLIATDLGWSPLFHDGSDISGFAGSLTPAPAVPGAPGTLGLTGPGGIIGVGLEYALSPYKDFTITPNAYYLMADKDVNLAVAKTSGPGSADDFYGVEAGLQLNWRIWDSVVILGQFDYLITGDVFKAANGDKDDMWRFIVGPSISW